MVCDIQSIYAIYVIYCDWLFGSAIHQRADMVGSQLSWIFGNLTHEPVVSAPWALHDGFLAMENGPFIDGFVKNWDFLQLWMTDLKCCVSPFLRLARFHSCNEIHPFPTRYFVLGLTVIGCMWYDRRLGFYPCWLGQSCRRNHGEYSDTHATEREIYIYIHILYTYIYIYININANRLLSMLIISHCVDD